jgi:hypothetical protein
MDRASAAGNPQGRKANDLYGGVVEEVAKR